MNNLVIQLASKIYYICFNSKLRSNFFYAIKQTQNVHHKTLTNPLHFVDENQQNKILFHGNTVKKLQIKYYIIVDITN